MKLFVLKLPQKHKTRTASVHLHNTAHIRNDLCLNDAGKQIHASKSLRMDPNYKAAKTCPYRFCQNHHHLVIKQTSWCNFWLLQDVKTSKGWLFQVPTYCANGAKTCTAVTWLVERQDWRQTESKTRYNIKVKTSKISKVGTVFLFIFSFLKAEVYFIIWCQIQHGYILVISIFFFFIFFLCGLEFNFYLWKLELSLPYLIRGLFSPTELSINHLFETK